MAKRNYFIFSELTGTLSHEQLDVNKSGQFVYESPTSDINGKFVSVTFDKQEGGSYIGEATLGSEKGSISTFKIIDSDKRLHDGYTMSELIESNGNALGIADGFVEFTTRETEDSDTYCKSVKELGAYLISRTASVQAENHGIKPSTENNAVKNELDNRFKNFEEMLKKIDNSTKYDKKNKFGKADRVLGEVMNTKGDDKFGSLSSMIGVYNILKEDKTLTFEEAKEQYIDKVEQLDFTSKYFDQTIQANNEYDSLRKQADDIFKVERHPIRGAFSGLGLIGTGLMFGAVWFPITIGMAFMGLGSVVRGIIGNKNAVEKKKLEFIEEKRSERGELETFNKSRINALENFQNDAKTAENAYKHKDEEKFRSALSKARENLGKALQVNEPNSILGRALIVDRLNDLNKYNEDSKHYNKKWAKAHEAYKSLLSKEEQLNEKYNNDIEKEESLENEMEKDETSSNKQPIISDVENENKEEQNEEKELDEQDKKTEKDEKDVEIDKLKEENEALKKENANLKNEIESMKNEIESMKNEIESLKTKVDSFENNKEMVENNSNETSNMETESSDIAKKETLENKEEIATPEDSEKKPDSKSPSRDISERNDLKSFEMKKAMNRAYTELGKIEKISPSADTKWDTDKNSVFYKHSLGDETFFKSFNVETGNTTYQIGDNQPIEIKGHVDGNSEIWKTIGDNGVGPEALGLRLILQNDIENHCDSKSVPLLVEGHLNPEVLNNKEAKNSLDGLIVELANGQYESNEAKELIENIANDIQEHNEDSVEKESKDAVDNSTDVFESTEPNVEDFALLNDSNEQMIQEMPISNEEIFKPENPLENLESNDLDKNELTENYPDNDHDDFLDDLE